MDREPVRIPALVSAGAAALVTLLVAFGVDLTKEQATAILGLVAVLAPVVAGWVARRWAYAPATVRRLTETGNVPFDARDLRGEQ